MVVVIRVGRRVHRNNDKKWFLKQVGRIKNTLSIQQYMWNTITYAFKLSTSAMDRAIKKNKLNPDFTINYTKKKYTEEESLNYNIDWVEISIIGSYEEELEEYNESMQFFDKLANNRVFKQRMGKVEIDEQLAAEYRKKVQGKKAKKIVKAGFEKVKDVTMAKALNDVGIIISIEAPEKPTTEEIAEVVNE